MAFRAAALFAGALGFGAAANSIRSAPESVARAYNADGSNKTLASLLAAARGTFDHQFRPFRLGEVINLAEDVAIFRFLTPNADDTFALAPCSTLQACFKSGTNIIEQVMRFYTPITENGTKGYFDLLVKKQPKGRMTETLFSMEVGESLFFRIVEYKLTYGANKWKHVGMIGGGTGITPLYQVIQHSLAMPEDKTKLSLLFANQTEGKILLRGCLDEYAEKHPRFDVNYTVDRAEPGWKGYTGHITEEMIKKHMPAPGRDMKILVCGPDGMMTALCGAGVGVLKAMSGSNPWQPAGGNMLNFTDVEGVLGKMGYDKEMLYRF